MTPNDRPKITSEEIAQLDAIVKPFLEVKTHHYGAPERGVVRYDKRPKMYGGEGTVYLMQLFDSKELANNRIAAYMILPSQADSVGFHTHGTRKEQELYLVIQGEGEYAEKDNGESTPRKFPLTKGNLTSIKGAALHSVRNTGDGPLIIFVITTYESQE